MSERGKVVVLTGASRGLGLAIAKDLLTRKYRIATCSRSSSPELEALRAQYGEEFLYWMECSIGEAREEEAFFSASIDWGGAKSFYGLINNAAIAGEGILATFPVVDAERILQTNLMSALRLSRLALRTMLQVGVPGRIVNISSIVGLRGYTGLAAYSASKAGLDGLTRALAREVGRRGITVNSVAPGYLETAMSAGLAAGQKQQIISRTPLGRLGTTDDVVPAVRFLLSEDAAFLTGQTIVIDGGISA